MAGTPAYLSADATVSAHKAVPINLTNDTALSSPCRGLLVGGGGTILAQFADDNATTITLAGLQAGVIYPFQLTKILSTANGTTATSLVALY